MLLLKHRLKRVHRWHIQRDAPFLSAFRSEARLLFVTDVQHSSVPIDIGELEKEHLLAPKTGVRIQHDELWPVIEIQWMRATRLHRGRNEQLQLFLREVIGADGSI